MTVTMSVPVFVTVVAMQEAVGHFFVSPCVDALHEHVELGLQGSDSGVESIVALFSYLKTEQLL